MTMTTSSSSSRSSSISTVVVWFVFVFVFVVSLLCSAHEVSARRRRRRRRHVWTWTSHKLQAESIAQLRNATWSDMIDGIQVWCDCVITKTGLELNPDTWKNGCVPIIAAARETNTEFHLMLEGGVPETADPRIFISDAIQIQAATGVDGFSLDDESNCAPRATTSNFTKWMTWVDVFIDGMHDHGVPVSDAIQAVFAIEDSQTNDACSKAPSAYPLPKTVVERLSDSSMDKWLIMDTYYFTTGRFLGALDWHKHYLPIEKLGVGIQNRDNWSEDELVARFHAIHQSNIDWINVFEMPIGDAFLPYLLRWKTHCQGCGEQPLLGCFDMQIECDCDSPPVSLLVDESRPWTMDSHPTRTATATATARTTSTTTTTTTTIRKQMKNVVV